MFILHTHVNEIYIDHTNAVNKKDDPRGEASRRTGQDRSCRNRERGAGGTGTLSRQAGGISPCPAAARGKAENSRLALIRRRRPLALIQDMGPGRIEKLVVAGPEAWPRPVKGCRPEGPDRPLTDRQGFQFVDVGSRQGRPLSRGQIGHGPQGLVPIQGGRGIRRVMPPGPTENKPARPCGQPVQDRLRHAARGEAGVRPGHAATGLAVLAAAGATGFPGPTRRNSGPGPWPAGPGTGAHGPQRQ